MKQKIFLSIILILIFFITGGYMLKKVLCSEFRGKLVDDSNSPVPNIKVVRKWKWAITEDSGSDETVTDVDGKFSFPEQTGFSFLATFLPHEPSIDTSIIAYRNERETLLFSVQKSNYASNGEWIKAGLEKHIGVRLNCEVDKKDGTDGPFWGTCTLQEFAKNE